MGGQKDANEGDIGQNSQFAKAYNNIVNANNYKIQFTISKDDSSLVFTSNIDGSYQEITERKNPFLVDTLSIMRIWICIT